MRNPNKNILAGMKCPECGSYGPFNISVKASVCMSDNGFEDVENVEWDEENACVCNECGHCAKVSDFREDEDESGE